MKIAGIIAEYNPFHNGHAYHLAQAKKQTLADFIIVLMSGSFVQRGECAIADKYTRTACALSQGADLVLELPALYSTASAEYFSMGAVRTLDVLGVVTHLAFGCESTNLTAMQSAAKILLDEPQEYKQALKEALSLGMSYPTARQQALSKYAPALCKDLLLDRPNAILGLEYCKALHACGSTILPVAIARKGGEYHQLKPDRTFSSASSIKNQLLLGSTLNNLSSQIPNDCITLLENAWAGGGPIFADDLSFILHFALLQVKNMDYTPFADVNRELSNRIRRHIWEYQSFSQFAKLLKTKELTYSRICRCLIHILLGITKTDVEQADTTGSVPYLRILGIRKDAASLLGKLKRHAGAELITSPADGLAKLSGIQKRMLELDCRAAHIQNSLFTAKYGKTVKNEFARKLLKW